MYEGHDAVDIWVCREFFGRKGLCDKARCRGRTIDRRQNGNIVSRANPTGRPAIPHESIDFCRRSSRSQVCCKFISCIDIAKLKVVGVNMRAFGNILSSIANDLCVFPDHAPPCDCFRGHLVSAWDDLRGSFFPGGKLTACCDDIVGGIKSNGV